MNSKVALGAAIAVVLILAAFLSVGMWKSDAGEQATPRPEETRPLGIPASARVDAVTLPEGDDAAEVYAAVTREVEALSRRAGAAGSPEEQMRIVEEMVATMEAFRARFAGSPEAVDAAFQLGAIHHTLQQFDDAAKFLGEYIGKADPSERQKLAFAHYYLADSYRATDRFDDAEGEFKFVLAKYSDVNARLTSTVQTNLAMLESERKVAVGGEPIPFTVKGLKGETLSPGVYKGKVLLIDFWATWCLPCIAEMPNVKNVYRKYHSKGFEIVGISLDQSREKLDAYLKQQQIEWPQYFDGKWWNNDVASMYGIRSIPATLLVDRHGKIRYKSLRGRQLESAVEKLLAESS